MTTWTEALETIREDPDWTHRDGFIIWANPDKYHLALIKPRVSQTCLDPKLERLNRKIAGDVEFDFDINDHSGISDFLKAWTSYFEDDIELDSIPKGYIYPISYDWTVELRRVHFRANISTTPLSSWWGQDSSRLVGTGITINASFDQGREGVLYNRYDLLKDALCPFCLLDDFNESELFRLPKVNEEYHGARYYLMTCPGCDVVVDTVEKSEVDFYKDLIWNE